MVVEGWVLGKNESVCLSFLGFAWIPFDFIGFPGGSSDSRGFLWFLWISFFSVDFIGFPWLSDAFPLDFCMSP